MWLKAAGLTHEQFVEVVKKSVTDGPFTESKEVIGGFFIVEAKSLDEAVQLSKDSPDFEIGGSVEVREVMKM